MKTIVPPLLNRRRFVLGASSAVVLTALPLSQSLPANAAPTKQPEVLSGQQFDLHIGYQQVNFTGTECTATTVNGSLPAPILRWQEGERVTLRVTNHLKHETSIHWHGIVLPSTMDGSPEFDFDGIKPGETFEYQFDVKQSGTYWYHSHSGFQEQTGLFGAIIITPKEPDPVSYDRDMVVLLSDWSDEAPEQVYSKLKKMSHYYNFRERTLGDTWRDVKTKGIARTWAQRSMWNTMRMSETDIADVTGYTYSYLMNGVTSEKGWLGLCKAGEKVRLRFINGAGMSFFDVRIPGLTMSVVAADGQNIQSVSVDEFRIAPAETYDVIVTLGADSAYTVFAQTMDRSGYVRGTLTTNASLQAEIPLMDAAPTLGHRDMGMDMSGMDMGAAEHQGHDMSHMESMDHSGHDMAAMDMSGMEGMDMSDMDMSAMDHSQSETQLVKAGFGNNISNKGKITHAKSEVGAHVDMKTAAPQSGLSDPGIGLRDHLPLLGRKVLSYADLRSLQPTRDKREPLREIELHLTGNMHRYMWSFNGMRFADAAPLVFTYNERVRIILVNDTMMTHPIHLHGMWSELETGDPEFIPRKHTVIVQPGAKISYLLTADAKGDWAFHCHLLHHMSGMMRRVRVV